MKTLELNFDKVKEMQVSILNAPEITRHVELLSKLSGEGGTYAFDVLSRLYELEEHAHEIITEQCNTGGDEGDETLREILQEVRGILTEVDNKAIFINYDPRGYALKIKDDYIRENNIRMWTDFGGYGILAPDFQ